jgi:acyl-CoA thioesterase-1
MRGALPVALLALFLAGPAAAAGAECTAPADLTRLHGALARTTMRLTRHEALTIVASGSSSTAGFGASAPDWTYPSQLAAALRRRAPDTPVTVINKGVGGETSFDMIARFDRDVLALDPDLVVWQVGTNAVLHDYDVAAYQKPVRRGIERLKSAGIDVILLDMQFAPQVTAHAGYRDMETNLAAIGKDEGIPLFPRFAVMQHWVASGQFSVAAMLSPDGLHMNDRSYRCLGRLLGDAIVDRTRPRVATSRH